VFWKRALAILALSLFGLSAVHAAAAETAPDADVTKGIQQVNDGDYEAAIITLDKAVRRLSAEPTKIRDLAQGYLYLGIAYVGKGHEAAAKAKFREAVAQMKDLSLSPDQFPPKVINLFEAAKEEARRLAPAAAAPATPTGPPAAPRPVAQKKGGSKKLLLIGGGLVLAGGAAAVVAGGGGGSSPTEGYRTENRQAIFMPGDTYHHYTFGPGSAGRWRAEVSWADGNKFVGIGIFTASEGTFVVEGHRTSPTVDAVEWDGAVNELYQVDVWIDDAEVAGGAVSYQLAVQIPNQ
jgi:hypothetical protein